MPLPTRSQLTTQRSRIGERNEPNGGRRRASPWRSSRESHVKRNEPDFAEAPVPRCRGTARRARLAVAPRHSPHEKQSEPNSAELAWDQCLPSRSQLTTQRSRLRERNKPNGGRCTAVDKAARDGSDVDLIEPEESRRGAQTEHRRLVPRLSIPFLQTVLHPPRTANRSKRCILEGPTREGDSETCGTSLNC